MAYQSFPWQPGDSDSVRKLCSLFLPDLKGKKVLDVGCNTGFFCGWAEYKQAAYVKGVDNNPLFLKEAKSLFPTCKFQYGNWEDLGASTYDVILFLSALHYAEDQKRMIDLLMERLEPTGMLVLELGIAPGEQDDFVEVRRQFDCRLFPTWTKLRSMLAPYSYKCIGASVAQAGDPLPRYVVHVTHKKPLAITLLGASYSGKTSLAQSIFAKELVIISGDALLGKIRAGTAAAADMLVDFLQDKSFSDFALVVADICRAGLLGCFAEAVVQAAHQQSFVYDGYIPAEFQREFLQYLHDKNFYVVDMACYSAMLNPHTLNVPSGEELAGYIEQLKTKFGFDEEAYLLANPDVAQAVKEKKVQSGFNHYVYFGKREKRRLK